MSETTGTNQQSVLITGGTTGIGFASAMAFINNGAKVFLTGRNPETLAEAREKLGDSAIIIPSDASDPESIEALVEEIKTQTDRLDAIILNAGIFRMTPIENSPVEEFDILFNTNVRGPWLLVQKSIPLLHEGSSITWVTSSVNEMGWANMSAYAATKAAARSMVRTLAAELAPKSIRVNAIAPGPVATPIFGKANIPEEQKDGMADQITSMVPLGRMGQPEEIGSAVAFISSNQASFVTGAEWAVDGGIGQV